MAAWQGSPAIGQRLIADMRMGMSMFHFQIPVKEKNTEVRRQQYGKYDRRRRRRMLLTSGRRASSPTTSDLEGRENIARRRHHLEFTCTFRDFGHCIFWYIAMCIEKVKMFRIWNLLLKAKVGFQIQLFNSVVMNLTVSVAIFRRRMRRAGVGFFSRYGDTFFHSSQSLHISQNKARCPDNLDTYPFALFSSIYLSEQIKIQMQIREVIKKTS